MSTWIAVILVGAGSYAARSIPLLRSRGHASTGGWRDRLVRRAGLAAIAAMVAGSLRHHGQAGSPDALAAALTAAAVAAGAARRRSFGLAVAAGLASYVLVHAAVAALG